ncbi:MAG TPA: helix-turn-helix domain-containing protein [Candidatus Avisuccinivibrio pullicola]|nr:helix-turn-helix domain-containing protein [Candidatus Avisuccinivibrio pullicola]
MLAARAAINGGLAVETAYTTADFFILAAEMAKTVEEARLLRETITWRFAELVSKVKERETRQYRAQVRLLINELNRNIFNPVTRKEIVACINRNIDYAERIFKEDVGMSMMEYLRQERIRVACDLLLNSQQKVGEIALLLNFSSSSHFARVFKEITGESPLDYRERLTLAPRRRLA